MKRNGAKSETGLFEDLRALRERRATGLLEVEAGGQKRRLYLRDGELHLPGAHPLARRLGELLAQAGEKGSGGSARRELFELVQKIAEVFGEWTRDLRRFQPGVGGLPGDLAGPVPTARLLLFGATVGSSDAELDKRFRAHRGRFVVSADAERRIDRLGWSPEEAFVLERLRLPMTVDELARQIPMPRPALLRALAGLLGLGAVRAELEATTTMAAGGRELASRLAERIAKSLVEEPLDLEPEEYRERIADLLARHGGLDHYELIGARPGDGTEKIQAAFESMGRLVHPDNAGRYGWSGREETLRMLFESGAAAYESLSDPERRREYHQRLGIVTPGETPTGARRQEEVKEIAREQHNRGLAYAAAGDVHNAIQMFEQAVKTEPKAEYWCSLARLQSRNPSWTQRALESYRRALQLEPTNADVRFAMGELFEHLGELERARVQFSAAVRANPDHFEAVERLRRIEEQRAPKSEGSGNLFSRFFRRD